MGDKPRYVIEHGMYVNCPDCRENQRWEGKGRKAVKACGCIPEPMTRPEPLGRLKSAPTTAAKGRRGEVQVQRLLARSGASSKRTAGSGATGSRNGERSFDTDLRTTIGGMPLRVEVKTLAKVPGLASMVNLLAGSDLLHVKADNGVTGYWLIPDKHAVPIFEMANEGAER